jgi:hypothetical protein
MREVKRQFGGGAMNKDLDERILPNGQYRDALNIQVSSSEASDVGAVQNILGNRRPYGNALANLGNNPVCIGAYVNSKTEMIYWFIASDTKSIILEYDQTNNVVSPVLVDVNNILNFSTFYLITGINIIDDLLFWTDDQTEPKKINIKTWKGYNSSNTSYTHTQINSADFTEDQITVIKKSPLSPPTITMSATKRTGVVETSLIQKSFTETTSPFDLLDTGDYGNVTFSNAVNYLVGDKLKLTLLEEIGDSADIEVILSVTQVISSTTYNVNLDVVPEDIAENLQNWKVELIEEKPMFEFKFPQFSYRYKFNDNEYSSIGPYSPVAFLPDNFNYDPKNGYNKGMVNNLRSLKIGGFTSNAPDGVKEIDILYKESSNNNIYVVQSIKTTDPEYIAGTNGEIEITSDVIFKVLPSIQSLRPFDNVPRKAKAQALSANRIMYGNYLENFNIEDASGADISVKFEVSIVQNDNLNVVPAEPKPSIKSIRTYQVGVVYRDKYGRETPVFTDPSGSFTLDKSAAINYNVIKVRITSAIPHWAESYKYYIKESSDEYYNLAMDRHYEAEDGNVWIAFASSERNKITDESFLILKKRHDANDFVADEARYKVIAVSNEAPTFLKEDKVSKGVLSSANTDTSGTNIFKGDGHFPEADFGHVSVLKSTWEKVFGGGSPNDNDSNVYQIPVHQLSDLVLRIIGNGGISQWYDIANIQYFDTGNSATAYYRVEIEEKFEEDDVRFARNSDASAYLQSDDSVSMEIAQKQIKLKPEFEGRFFAKIERDGVLEENILRQENIDDYKIAASIQTYDLANYGSSQSFWQGAEKGTYPGSNENSRQAEWFINKQSGLYRISDAGGSFDTSASGGGHIRGQFSNPDTAISTAGNGVVSGSDIIEIAYHWWGGDDRDAWRNGEPFWYRFERDFKPQYRKIVGFFQQRNSKFRFEDDPDQTIYTIKSYRRTHWIPYRRGGNNRKGRYGSERMICWTLKLDKAIDWAPGDNGHTTKATATRMEFVNTYIDGDGFTSNNPAIFETEPKEVADLNLFYEASQAYDDSVHGNEQTLDYSNCFSFGNGVESNRIRDDFNAAQITKGIKASTVLDIPYAEERKSNQVIFSGLYNSTSGTNNTNQFIQADQITKSINPVYGSIQLMRHRHGGLDVLCEDKCFKIPTNKDILFTADGSKQVSVSSNVLGTPNPYTGEFGISKNPESYTQYGYRAYFSDKARGVILRLSADGLEPISRYGLEDYFKDHLAASTTVIGSYDTYKKEYNVTLNFDTVSFKEDTNAWTSRKSFLQEEGVSLNNIYYTFKDGQLWSHDNQTRNSFYGTQYNSSIKFIFNDAPGSVKQFKTLNYEGSQARIFQDNSGSADTDNYFPNKFEKAGWWSNSIESDKQSGQVLNFEEKEGKWFNFIKGTAPTSTNIDTSEFSVQGLGNASVAASNDYSYGVTITVNENND